MPGPPGKPDVTAIDATEMTIKWAPPETDGGSPIIGYTVERKDVSSTRWSRVNRELVSETTMKVTGLMERSEYMFRVIAENKAGPGPPSESSDIYMAKPPFGKSHAVLYLQNASSFYIKTNMD